MSILDWPPIDRQLATTGDECGLWWILSTVTTGFFAGIAIGLVFWLWKTL